MGQTLINVTILLSLILISYCLLRIMSILRAINEVKIGQDVINEANTKMFCILMEELREHQSLKKKA